MYDAEKTIVTISTKIPVGSGFPLIMSLEDFAEGNSIVPKQNNDSAKIKRGKKTYILSKIADRDYSLDLSLLSWSRDAEYLSVLEKTSSVFNILVTYDAKPIIDFRNCMIQKMPDGAIGDGVDTGEITFSILVGDGFYHLTSL